jgi:hypothetical protein
MHLFVGLILTVKGKPKPQTHHETGIGKHSFIQCCNLRSCHSFPVAIFPVQAQQTMTRQSIGIEIARIGL